MEEALGKIDFDPVIPDELDENVCLGFVSRVKNSKFSFDILNSDIPVSNDGLRDDPINSRVEL